MQHFAMLLSYRQSEILLRYFGAFILFLVYLLISFHMGRGLFVSEVDGFMSQIVFIEKNSNYFELGALSGLHGIRYLIAKPFLWIDNIWFEPALFFCYIGVAFFFAKHWQMRLVIKLSLIFSLFFSYRTVLCMYSMALLTQYILSELNGDEKYVKEPLMKRYKVLLLFYGLLFAFLSSGVLILYLLLFFSYRKLIIRPIRRKWIFNAIYVFSVVAVFGAVVHKILFLSDAESFGSASAISMQSFFILDISLIPSIFSNLLERSMLIGVLNNDSLRMRIYIIVGIGFLMAVLLCIRRDRLSVLFVMFFLFGLFVEGLAFYSLLISIFLLITQGLIKKINFRRRSLFVG